MKRTLSSAAALTALWLTAAWAASSQVQVVARAFPEKATLGGEIRLVLRVDRPRDWSLRPPSPETKLEPFELKSVDRATELRGKNRVGETFILTLTAFELGRLTIPPVSITAIDDKGRESQALSDPVSVEIVSVSKTPPDKAQLKPIKGPVSMDLGALRTLLLGAAAAALALVLAVKIWLRLRAKGPVDPESLKPPHERALLEFGRLKKTGLAEKGKLKEHYSGLSDILRRYVHRRFGVDAKDLTTGELLRALKESSMSPEALEIARDVLQESDLVKFAKYEPARAETVRTEGQLEEFVRSTKPEPAPAKTAAPKEAKK